MKHDGNYEQWLFYREKRLQSLFEQYAIARRLVPDFEHSSVGLALLKKITELESDLLPDPYRDEHCPTCGQDLPGAA